MPSFFMFQDNLESNFNVMPVCLPIKGNICYKSSDEFVNTHMRVAGWGNVDNDEEEGESFKTRATIGASSACLQKLDVPVKQSSFCSKFNDKYSPKKQLCAGGIEGM